MSHDPGQKVYVRIVPRHCSKRTMSVGEIIVLAALGLYRHGTYRVSPSLAIQGMHPRPVHWRAMSSLLMPKIVYWDKGWNQRRRAALFVSE